MAISKAKLDGLVESTASQSNLGAAHHGNVMWFLSSPLGSVVTSEPAGAISSSPSTPANVATSVAWAQRHFGHAVLLVGRQGVQRRSTRQQML